MKKWFLSALRYTIIMCGNLASRLFFQVTIVGRENLPKSGPFILVANHFSWFDPLILALYLPYTPTFLIATETLRNPIVQHGMNIFDYVPIWRGQVDRTAIRSSLKVLEQGGILGIFPEGGVQPELAEIIARGEQITEFSGHASRLDAQVTRPRPGTAFLAIQSKAKILPVGLLGTERITTNIQRFRRTKVTLYVGTPFGPLTMEPGIRGLAKRQQLEAYSDLLMQNVATLLPAENRGPYSIDVIT